MVYYATKMITSTSAANILALALLTAIELPIGSLTATTISTMPVENRYTCQNGTAILWCYIEQASHSNDRKDTKCRWWQNDKELSSSLKFDIGWNFHRGLCCLRIYNVQKKPDAQPTNYRCRDGDTVGQVTYRLWLQEEFPFKPPVLTVGGQELADGGILNLTALSHQHPPPIIQCSAGPMAPHIHLVLELKQFEESLEDEMSWKQENRSQVPGHMVNSTVQVLVNDTELVAGQTLCCSVEDYLCQLHKKFKLSLEVTIIGKLGSTTATPTTSTMSVKNMYTCKDEVAMICDIHSASHNNDSQGNECRWWQNDKELSRSSKYMIGRVNYGSYKCYLIINDVQEKQDAQPTDYRCSDGNTEG